MKLLITGTNSGIGKYLSKNLEKDFEIYKISKSNSSETNFYKCDLTKKLKIEKLDFGNNIFDLIIFNAGIGYFGDFFQENLKNYEEMIKLNILGNIRLLKKLENNINKNTKFIFIGSYAGKKFFKNGAVYTASKFAIRGFAGALKKDGKKVFLLNPKIVETNFHKGKLEIEKSFENTSLESILNVIRKIITGKENSFEIDL